MNYENTKYKKMDIYSNMDHGSGVVYYNWLVLDLEHCVRGGQSQRKYMLGAWNIWTRIRFFECIGQNDGLRSCRCTKLYNKSFIREDTTITRRMRMPNKHSLLFLLSPHSSIDILLRSHCFGAHAKKTSPFMRRKEINVNFWHLKQLPLFLLP